jgi:hypothetical protein
MTDYEMKKAIFAWVKQKPARRLKLLKQWRKDLQNDFIDGVFDPIGEVPTVGDRAFHSRVRTWVLLNILPVAIGVLYLFLSAIFQMLKFI